MAGQAGVPREFRVTLDMVSEGVQLYYEYDYDKAEPEALIMDILFAARDIWRQGITQPRESPS